MKSAYEIRIHIASGRNGRPRSGDGRRVLLGGCRVKPETAAQLSEWLADFREADEKMNNGRLVDWLVELAQKRAKKISMNSDGKL